MYFVVYRREIEVTYIRSSAYSRGKIFTSCRESFIFDNVYTRDGPFMRLEFRVYIYANSVATQLT